MATHTDQHASADTGHGDGEQRDHARMERRQYLRFGAMIATSTVVMFCLTYTNTYAWDHVRWSEATTRADADDRPVPDLSSDNVRDHC